MFTMSPRNSAALLTNAALAGWAADRGARSTPFLWGLVLATISTLTFCLARAPAWLVLARVLQGLAASVIYTAGLSLVTDAVGPDEVGTWYERLFQSSTWFWGTKSTSQDWFCVQWNDIWPPRLAVHRWHRLRPRRLLCCIWNHLRHFGSRFPPPHFHD